MNRRFVPFRRLTIGGAALYVGAYFGVGFIFSGTLAGAVKRGYQVRSGHGIGCDGARKWIL